jgi:hypothetical protein
LEQKVRDEQQYESALLRKLRQEEAEEKKKEQ